MPLESITALVRPEFQPLKQIILDNINSNVGLVDELASHILKKGGKRVRPLLLLLVAKACGYEGTTHLMPAAAIEYFHTATLLHDDVLDESKVRRGVNTANEIWGAKASILVGDILLTQSMQFMTQTGSIPMLKVLLDAAHEITCGEVKQLVYANNGALSIDEYFDVIRAKTALLFSAAAEIGAMASNASQEIIVAMREFGLHLGNAFQIIDDLLDYQADEKTLGKRPGDDLRDGKLTLPLIFAINQADEPYKKLMIESVANGCDKNLDTIITLMHETNAFKQTQQTAQNEADKALSSLHCLPDSDAKQALISLVNFTVNRNH
mgnify:CR=1 FL=1